MQMKYNFSYSHFDKDQQEEVNNFCNKIRREGVILSRLNREDQSSFFIEWQGDEYHVIMRVGDVIKVRKSDIVNRR